MSFTAICPAINTQLAALAGEHAPQMKTDQNGFVLALNSEYNYNAMNVGMTNRAGSPLELMSPDGRVHRIQIMNQQRATADEMGSTPLTCHLTGETTVADNFAKEIDPYNDGNLMAVTSPILEIDEHDVRELCENFVSWRGGTMMRQMNGMVNKMNQDLITKASTLFGNYLGGTNSGTSPISLDLIQTSSGQSAANYFGEVLLHSTLSDARLSGIPMVIGNGYLRDYNLVRKVGCCNRVGIDLNAPVQYAWFEDNNVGEILSDPNAFIALEAGAFGFIPLLENVGEYAKQTATFTQGTIYNPLINMMFDLKMQFDEDCSKWKLRMYLNYYPLALYDGADMYKGSDPLYGVNGIYKFLAD